MPRFLFLYFLQSWYNLISKLDKQGSTVFMNYGYSSKTPLKISQSDEPNRHSLQLYHLVTSGAVVKGKNILEVGSGRGGGAAFVVQYFKPQHYTAIDFSIEAIRFCSRKYSSIKSLSFVHGNAEALPFSDRTYDAVINVESSHGYPHPEAFFFEVHRVLRPGGYFLYTDFRPTKDLDMWVSQLKKSGFLIKKQIDITDNVIQALHQDDSKKRALINSKIPFGLRTIFYNFAGTIHSSIYNEFLYRKLTYKYFVLQKPQTSK